MSENIFCSALQKITLGSLSLGELIETASALKSTGQHALGRQLYKIWINFNPDDPQLYVAHYNCAELDSHAGDNEAARKSLETAIALNPDFLPAYINLGNALERSGAPDKAIELWKFAAGRPMQLTGSNIEYAVTALIQIARVLSNHKKKSDTEAAFRQCLDIDSNQPLIAARLVAMRLGNLKWPVVAPFGKLDRKTLMEGIHPLGMTWYTDDPLLQLAASMRYARREFDARPKTRDADRRNAAIDLETRRLRVGYVSSDLRDHAIGYLMAELFELHNKAEFEVFAYYCGPASNSAQTNRIKAALEHWTDIRALTNDEAALRIAADGIDILVDINGHTSDARTGVFARRPAPIQVSWLGYPGPMGTPYHHYIIADDWIVPPESEIYYSEKIARLPCYQPNDRKRPTVAPGPTRRDAGLPENGVVFCCFNGAQKFSRFCVERWFEILKRVPDSVLWLLDGAKETNGRLADLAEQNGIARTRLIFAPPQRNDYHLARYPLADLFLDTAPYGAHTTSSDALWMGVPVLTLSGRGFASRVCGSLVRSAGVPDLVCSTPEEYVERAVELGNNPAQIQVYKAKLEAGRNTCTLFDMDKLVQCLENLYRAMCDDYHRGCLPRPDLANLDAYFEAGIEHDHEAEEVLAISDYHGMYKEKLARLHSWRPIPSDNRLWSAADIAMAEQGAGGSARVSQPVVLRKTGTDA